MNYLYVCLFSNGHIKVGRSINPMARIADRVLAAVARKKYGAELGVTKQQPEAA